MPSPLAHATVGALVYRFWPQRWIPRDTQSRRLLMLAAVVVFTFLPDADAVPGFLLGDFGRYHNNLSHSLLVAVVAAAAGAGVATGLRLGTFRPWFTCLLTCVGLHLVMDAFTIGRGLMLFWPLTSARFLSPLQLFVGLHWSDGLVSPWHPWTLLNEGLFALCSTLLAVAIARLPRRDQP